MTIESIGPYAGPSSREINVAIETLRRAGLEAAPMADLDRWNAVRLVEAALKAPTHEALRNLFVGLEIHPMNGRHDAERGQS